MLLIKPKFYGFSIFQALKKQSLTWQEEENNFAKFLSFFKVRSSWQQPRICWRSILNYFLKFSHKFLENVQKLLKISSFCFHQFKFSRLQNVVSGLNKQSSRKNARLEQHLCIHLHRLLTLPNHSCLAQQ